MSNLPYQIDTAAQLRSLVKTYQAKQRPITVNFRALLPDLNSADRLTHLIHPYPAKLLMHIPFFFLSNNLLSQPGDMVLDPFCGSGTVLLEAQAAARRSQGADANPLARLIAQVKTTYLEAKVLTNTLNDILATLPSKSAYKIVPDVINLNHWFYPHVIRELICLRDRIAQIKHPEIQRFFHVCFSCCVRKVSLADPRLAVPVKLKSNQYPRRHPLHDSSDAHLRRLRHVRVANVFYRIAQSNITRMDRLAPQGDRITSSEIICSDARNLRNEYSTRRRRIYCIPPETVQLIITSPPYPGAQKYIRSSSLSLGWLGLCPVADLRSHKARIIGREEFRKSEIAQLPATGINKADKLLARIYKSNPIRGLIASTYLNDMHESIKEMSRVLKPGGHLVLVAANNQIANRTFRTVDYLSTMAEWSGLQLTAHFMDVIRSRGLMTKRNHTASMITRESVLIFTKGCKPKWTR